MNRPSCTLPAPLLHLMYTFSGNSRPTIFPWRHFGDGWSCWKNKTKRRQATPTMSWALVPNMSHYALPDPQSQLDPNRSPSSPSMFQYFPSYPHWSPSISYTLPNFMVWSHIIPNHSYNYLRFCSQWPPTSRDISHLVWYIHIISYQFSHTEESPVKLPPKSSIFVLNFPVKNLFWYTSTIGNLHITAYHHWISHQQSPGYTWICLRT